ncbi:MAG: hypothetical protein M0R17_04190 [Candidatus Omnitrophica bacterium]|jgi:predicted kinase|nr:hypothetical protein [Candidatus Omnitrophota bacterium]
MNKFCILLRSYPGGGKSYIAAKYAKENDAVICSADDFWIKDGKYVFELDKLKIAHRVCFEKFKKAIADGKNVVIDNTNLNFEDCKKYLDYVVIHNNTTKDYYSADILEVTYNSIDEAIKLRSNREDGKNISESQMIRMFNAFKRTNAITLLYSNYKNKFNFIFEHEVPVHNYFENFAAKNNRESAVLCDLDGTISLFKMPDGTSLRNPFDASKADCDIINVAVATTLSALELVGNKIIFLSGREDKYREPTLSFLARVCENYGLDKNITLLMRKSGDNRPDDIVKNEIYNESIKDKFNILAVFDDRPKVVRMWRSLGLMVFECNYRMEDF